MAKKKSATHPQDNNKTTQEVEKGHHHSQKLATNDHFSPAPMDDSTAEKLESLKSLNAMLLKETVERRQQVDSLLLSTASLETQLKESDSEKETLKQALAKLGERNALLETEKDEALEELRRHRLEIESRMREVLEQKTEIQRMMVEKETDVEALNRKLSGLMSEIQQGKQAFDVVCQERDAATASLNEEAKESNRLNAKLGELEEALRMKEKEYEKLAVERVGLAEDKHGIETQLKVVIEEKSLMERCLQESNAAIEALKRKIEGILKDKEGLEKQRDVEVRKSNGLERTVNELKESTERLRNEELMLCTRVMEFEKRYAEGVDREKEMQREINGLVAERMEMSKRFEDLVKENGLLEKDLDEMLKRLDEEKVRLKAVIKERTEMEAAKIDKENEIIQLVKQLDEFRNAVLGLEESSKSQAEKIMNLESEVGRYRDILERVKIERDDAKRGLDQEMSNRSLLNEKISEMEVKIQQTFKVVEEFKAENTSLIVEKKELESRYEMLRKEISSMEDALADAQKECDASRAKLELADANSGKVFDMLRSTAEFVCLKDGKNVVDNGLPGRKKTNGEVNSYLAELESIKKAFKYKESKVEDLKRQLEFMQNSVVEAQKKKSFWTIVSSATTLFAAVSVAYLARSR